MFNDHPYSFCRRRTQWAEIKIRSGDGGKCRMDITSLPQLISTTALPPENDQAACIALNESMHVSRDLR